MAPRRLPALLLWAACAAQHAAGLVVSHAASRGLRRGAVGGALGDGPVTPVQKVIELLESLALQVEEQGKHEAVTYNDFACQCKDKTDSASKQVVKARDRIDELSADLDSDTAAQQEVQDEIKKRVLDEEQMKRNLTNVTEVCRAQRQEYDRNAEDLDEALMALRGAVFAVESSRQPAAASLLAIHRHLEASPAVAAALGGSSRRALRMLLQQKATVDPKDPEYKFGGKGILRTLKKLEADYKKHKVDLDKEWVETDRNCKGEKSLLEEGLLSNGDELSNLDSRKQALAQSVAQGKGDLVSEEGLLKEEEAFLKELTKSCEEHAQDWDERSKSRREELEVLRKALSILQDGTADGNSTTMSVEAADGQVNERAAAASLLEGQTANADAAPSLLQLAEVGSAVGRGRLRLRSLAERSATAAEEAAMQRRDRALDLLQRSGSRLGSALLSSLALRAAADPFGKVKGLIQQLLTRLLKEAQAEATKEGFCNTETAKAEKDRDFRYQEALKLSAEIEVLKAKLEALQMEIGELSADVRQLHEEQVNATAQRASERTENLATLETGRQGLAALRRAEQVLRSFYDKEKGPAADDDLDDGGSIDEVGRDDTSKVIFGLLEVIASDFERTLRKTAKGEQEAAEEFTKLERSMVSEISAKSTKVELDQADAEKASQTIGKKLKELETNMAMVDDALRTLTELRPVCVNNVMSYEERVAKREEEIIALKRAVCILDSEGVEPDCPNSEFSLDT